MASRMCFVLGSLLVLAAAIAHGDVIGVIYGALFTAGSCLAEVPEKE